MDNREGPRLTVEASCRGCSHEKSEYYCVEDGNDCDSGFTHSCAHPGAPRKPGQNEAHIGHSTDTPEWCPLLKAAREQLIESMKAGT